MPEGRAPEGESTVRRVGAKGRMMRVPVHKGIGITRPAQYWRGTPVRNRASERPTQRRDNNSGAAFLRGGGPDSTKTENDREPTGFAAPPLRICASTDRRASVTRFEETPAHRRFWGDLYRQDFVAWVPGSTKTASTRCRDARR